MEDYQEIRDIVKKQKKGHMVFLCLALILPSLILGAVQTLLLLGANKESFVYAIISFMISLGSMFITNTVLFLFIKRVREQRFEKGDIAASAKMLMQHFLAGVLLNVLQALLLMAAALTAVIPPVYYIVVSLIAVMTQLWSVLIAFGIYDQNHKVLELISGSFSLMKVHAKGLFKAAIPYILWYASTQLLLVFVFITYMPDLVPAGNTIALMIQSYDVGMIAFLWITLTNIIANIGGYVLSVPLFLFCANLYDRNKELYYPSCFIDKGRDFIEHN